MAPTIVSDGTTRGGRAMARVPKNGGVPAAEARQLFTTPGSSLGLRIDNVADSVKQVKHGLSYQKLIQFQHTSLLPMESITRVIQLPKRTMVRRKKSRKLS